MPRDWAYIMKRFREGNALKDKDIRPIEKLCRIFHKLEVCEYAGRVRYSREGDLSRTFLLRDKK